MALLLLMSVRGQQLGDTFPDICVIALPARRPYVRGVLDGLGAPNATYIDPVLVSNVDMRAFKPSAPMSRGEAACLLSHKKCISWYLDNGTAPRVLVFEDDVEVTVPNATRRLERAVRDLPKTWDALFVGRCYDRCWLDEPVAPGLVRARDPSCAHSIAYSRSGAAAFARKLRVMDEPADNMLNAMIHSGQLNAYAVKPGIFRQDNWRFGTTSGTAKPHYTEDCKADSRAYYAAGSAALGVVHWAMARKLGNWTHRPAFERRFTLAILNVVLAVALISSLARPSSYTRLTHRQAPISSTLPQYDSRKNIRLPRIVIHPSSPITASLGSRTPHRSTLLPHFARQ